MPVIIVKYTITDYEAFRKSFAKRSAIREAMGFRAPRMFPVMGNPNQVVVFGETVDPRKVRAGFATPTFKRLLEESGVVGTPVLDFMDQGEKFAA